MSRESEIAQSSDFAEFRRRFGNRALNEEDIYEAAGESPTLTHQGAPGDTWVWKAGSELEQVKDFSPFFPFDNGGETPYFRQRDKADRHEVGLYFEYVENGGQGEFEPVPLPSPERLERIANRNRA